MDQSIPTTSKSWPNANGRAMAAGKGNQTSFLQDLGKSIEERQTDSGWQAQKQELAEAKTPGQVLQCVPKNYQSSFSVVSPVSPYNKPYDLRCPERFLCLSVQLNGLLSQLKGEAAKGLNSIQTRCLSICPLQLVRVYTKGRTCILRAGNLDETGSRKVLAAPEDTLHLPTSRHLASSSLKTPCRSFHSPQSNG